MINSGREWDWIDDNSTIGEALRGWGFDMNGLKEGEGALSSLPPKATRAFSTKVSNDIPGFEGTMEQLTCPFIGRTAAHPPKRVFRLMNGVIMRVCLRQLLMRSRLKESV